MRKICAIYWLLLTALLLARDPLGWFHTRRTVDAVYEHLEPVAHFVSFALLSLLVLMSRPRLSRVWLFAILGGYSVATELVQSQVPGRRMESIDLVQDIAGILVGWCVFCIWQQIAASRKPATESLPEETWLHPRRRAPLANKLASDRSS
jgi:VanZ family protein